MASEPNQQRVARIADLKKKLRARDGNPAYKENCAAIKAEIAKLEQHEKAAEEFHAKRVKRGDTA